MQGKMKLCDVIEISDKPQTHKLYRGDAEIKNLRDFDKVLTDAELKVVSKEELRSNVMKLVVAFGDVKIIDIVKLFGFTNVSDYDDTKFIPHCTVDTLQNIQLSISKALKPKKQTLVELYCHLTGEQKKKLGNGPFWNALFTLRRNCNVYEFFKFYKINSDVIYDLDVFVPERIPASDLVDLEIFNAEETDKGIKKGVYSVEDIKKILKEDD